MIQQDIIFKEYTLFLVKMSDKASLRCLSHESMISSLNNLIPEESWILFIVRGNNY